MIELKMEQRKEQWSFIAIEDGMVIAELEAIPYGDNAVLHNRIHKFTKSLLPVYRQMFSDIRGVLRDSGVKLIMPMTDQGTIKLEKFLRLMGFECFGQHKHIKFAVMEA